MDAHRILDERSAIARVLNQLSAVARNCSVYAVASRMLKESLPLPTTDELSLHAHADSHPAG